MEAADAGDVVRGIVARFSAYADTRGIGGAVDGAAAIVVGGVGVTAGYVTRDGTDIVCAADIGTQSEAVQQVAVKVAHDAAISITTCEAIGHSERGGAGAIADAALIDIAHDAAVIEGIGHDGVKDDAAGNVAVVDDAAGAAVPSYISRDASDI